MTDVLQWLLDLRSIDLDNGAPLSLRWHSQWPAWAVLSAIALVLAWTWLVYSREGGRRRARIAGGVARLLLLLLMLGLLAQPVLLLQRSRVEPSRVVLLVDDSASMATTDRYEPSKATESLARAILTTQPADTSRTTPTSRPDAASELSRRTRADLVRASLSAGEWDALSALARHNELTLFAFAGRARMQAGPVDRDDLGDIRRWISTFQPKGTQTDLVGAIDQVLSEARTGRLAAIVVASDGRSTAGGDIENVVRTAAEMQVPIHAVMFGSGQPRRDIVVGPALADETVFVGDLVAVRVRVDAEGYDKPMHLDVQLVDQADTKLAGQLIEVRPGQDPTQVELCHRPGSPGRLRMRAIVKPLAEESNTKNNAAIVEVNVVDAKIKVLYVEGYPRYEYRYLKNMLIRESTIVASCLLLSADEGFTQEGNEPIKRFPVTMEELEPFDVVIFGDVDPRGDWLSSRQVEMLLDWVGGRGGGFLMIAGPRRSPQAYLGTSIEKLIPVRIEPRTAPPADEALTTPFQLQLTLEGRRSSVFRFETDPNENDRTLADLPGMYWYSRTRGPMPGVEVLAEHPTVRTVDGPMPLLVIGRFGAGSRAFAAVEGTWRWRRDVGRRLCDAYWLQLIRRLTRSQFLGRDRRFVLQADRPRYDLGQPVTVSLAVLDKAEAAALPPEIPAEVMNADDRIVARVRLQKLGQGAETYEGVFSPTGSGSFTVRVPSSSIRPGTKPPSVVIHVAATSPELRRLGPDHQAIKTLARRTGGRAVGPGDIARIAEQIEDRSVQIPDDIREPLWDTKLVLALFVFIIGVEWVLRKAFGLV